MSRTKPSILMPGQQTRQQLGRMDTALGCGVGTHAASSAVTIEMALHADKRKERSSAVRLTNRASAAGDSPPATQHLPYLRCTLQPPDPRAASARPLQALVRRLTWSKARPNLRADC